MKLAILACLAAACLDAQTVIPIGQVQGGGPASAYVGRAVAVQGVVTARKSNGFFLQSPDADADGDSATSEGIFVFTSSAPPSVAAAGNLVRVSGTVAEFQTLTELTGPAITVLSTGNPLPSPVTLSAPPFERYEGMRVRVDSLTVVGPTGADSSFYGVLAGVARPFREPGIEPPAPLPAEPCCIPMQDGNPERLRVTGGLDVTAGATVTNLTGVLDFSSGSFTVIPETRPSATGNVSAAPVSQPAAGEFTIATFNMERFFDTVNDPGVSDTVPTPAAYDIRLRKAALVIRDVLRLPDILAVQEVENLGVLQDIATRLNAGYTAHLIEGNDPGGIDVGFLVKSSRVTVLNVTQEGKSATYTTPSGSSELLNDRPPLILRASAGSFPITVIANHLRSLNGIDDPADGPRVRAKRRAQAEYLARLIQERQLADPAERIVVLGDFNAFPFSDGYVDVVGAVRGAPTARPHVALASPDLLDPDLVDAAESVAPAQRYSYVFEGNAQTLDQVLFTQNLLPHFARLEYGRVDADFPEAYRNDPSRPERLSDHDPAVAYFRLTPAPAGVGIVSGAAPVAGRLTTYTVNVWNAPSVSFAIPPAAALDGIAVPAGWSCAGLECAGPAPATMNVTLLVRPDVPNGAALTFSATAGASTAASTTFVAAAGPAGRAVNAASRPPAQSASPRQQQPGRNTRRRGSGTSAPGSDTSRAAGTSH